MLRLRARVRVPLRATRGREPVAEVLHYVAVDDGRVDEVTAWVVPEAQYAELREGSIVRVTVGRGGRLAELQAVRHPGGAVPPPMDRCFTALTGREAEVPGVALRWDGPVTQVVVYSGEAGWVAVEPVTMATDGCGLAARSMRTTCCLAE